MPTYTSFRMSRIYRRRPAALHWKLSTLYKIPVFCLSQCFLLPHVPVKRQSKVLAEHTSITFFPTQQSLIDKLYDQFLCYRISELLDNRSRMLRLEEIAWLIVLLLVVLLLAYVVFESKALLSFGKFGKSKQARVTPQNSLGQLCSLYEYHRLLLHNYL